MSRVHICRVVLLLLRQRLSFEEKGRRCCLSRRTATSTREKPRTTPISRTSRGPAERHRAPSKTSSCDHASTNDASNSNQQRAFAGTRALQREARKRRESRTSEVQNGTKQQAKSEARPNEPSKPRAWLLDRERELIVLYCGFTVGGFVGALSSGGPALCASVFITRATDEDAAVLPDDGLSFVVEARVDPSVDPSG